MNRFIKIILLLFVVTTLYSSEELKKISIQLNWKYQFEFAGFIAAKEKGFYKDVGLDVDIIEFQDDISVIEEVKNERATFCIYDASYLNLYDINKPVVLLANYFKRPALILVTTQDIVVPEDLVGKKVMYVKDEFEFTSIGELLKQHNITENDIISVSHNFTADKFINGEVDAFTAFITNELYAVKKSKIPYRVMDPVNYGMRGGGLNLFTSYNNAKNNSKLVKKFIEASKKGWEYALSNKEEIVDLIYNEYSKIKSKDALMFEANETEKLMMDDIYKIGEILESVVLDDIKRIQKKNKEFNLSLDKFLFEKINGLENEIELTKEEIEHLHNIEKITMCVDPNWMPYEKIDKLGNHIGMTSEFMPILSKKIGIPFELVPTISWDQSIEFAKQRKCDIFSLAMSTLERLEYMNFTSPYITFPVVIATKNDELFIPNPEKIITREKVGIVKGYSMGEILKAKYPEHKIVDVKNIQDGLERVERGELYGFIGALPTVAYELQHKFISSLKITGKFERNYELGIGVRNDDPLLYATLEKAIHSVDENARQEILNKYISVKVESGFDYKILYEIFGVFIIIVAIIYFRNRKLSRYNKVLEENQEELYETQKMLKQSLESFEKLLDSVVEAVLVFENEKCIELNDVAIKMFGYSNKEELLGKYIHELVHKDSYKEVEKNLKLSYAEPYEITVRKKNGEKFTVLVKGTTAIINNRKVRISAIVDLTDIKQKDRILFQQSKMAAMGEMLENIAHQWRQPLSLISSVSTAVLLKKELKLSNEDDEKIELEKINKTAQHLSQTIEDFRGFFRKDKERVTFSILDAINKNFMLIEGVLTSNNIELIYISKDDALIDSYENEFTQALLNIISNAKDVLVKNDLNERFIFINLKKDENSINIEISDNGGGVDESIIDKIFEPYFTTKHQSQGTGIGLYMTHQIIEKHMDGKISVENVKFVHNNKNYMGAKFTIKFSL